MTVKTAPAALTGRDAALRARYLHEVLDVLYPSPCTRERRPPSGSARVAEYVVLPDKRRPRLLVPARSGRVAAAAVERYAEPQSRLGRLKRDAAALALRSGAGRVLLRQRVRVAAPALGHGIDGYLREALGTDLLLSVHIGPVRANRKPVLQLLTPAGDTVGFAKLGTGPLTRRLVRTEMAALTALADVDLRHLTVPALLHAGRFHRNQVMVQSALPVWRPRAAADPRRLATAMVEVAGAARTTHGRLDRSPYRSILRARLDAVVTTAEGRALGAAAERLFQRAGTMTLRYGAWHGDWAPWNMAVLSDTILVWDWERFTTGVPMGFDALHHELQRRIQASTDPVDAVERTVRAAGALLAPFDVPAATRPATALLYLVDLAVRYLADRQAEAGARLGVLGTWLLPVLIRRVEEL
ncbi:phosphotransferase [Rhizomonospora bruguierae]|uniref:phosphotransferase n=1 Tax=Rhizomonospora bruguierae TaxID=1581705 RepID=UPI001BCE85A0|nr:phosphotransferase [Micromonospora sp. NBRC 107566]